MLDPNFAQDVREFHALSGQPHGPIPRLLEGCLPFEKILQHLQAAFVLTKLPSEAAGELALRVGLLIEEVAEYVEATRDRNLVSQFDAILDITYVNLGTGVAQGLPLNAGWEEVHRANMAKVYGDTVTVGGKIQKPAGWVGPETRLKVLIERLTPVVLDCELLPPEVTPEVTPEEENDYARGTLPPSGERGQAEEAAQDRPGAEEGGAGSAGGGLYGKW